MEKTHNGPHLVHTEEQNLFVNDGSFMERFKKQLEATKAEKVGPEISESDAVQHHSPESDSPPRLGPTREVETPALPLSCPTTTTFSDGISVHNYETGL